MPVTLSDVAKRAGVSVATVSRVLNNKMVMPIPEATIARIRDAAAELNYHPNRLARALATGRTNTLGLFSDEMTDPQFAQMLDAVEARAAAQGYQIVVSTSLKSLLEDSRTDGTIILGMPGSFPDLDLSARPVIYVNQTRTPVADLIAWDDAEGMRRAVEHLVEHGHRQVAALWSYGDAVPQLPAKVAGFRDAAQDAGLEFVEVWEKKSANARDFAAQFEDGYQATWRLLDRGAKFTALVARNDFLALGALRALREARLRVPEDVSVVGYANTIQAVCADPSITSVRTPIAEAGEQAVDRLIAAINTPGTVFPGAILPANLIVRESTGPATGAAVSVVRTRAGYLTTREAHTIPTR